MATVNILQSKRLQTRAGLAFILSYCKRESKIRYGDRRLATGVNCVAESVYREMMNTKMQYGKTDGRMYYHFVQSFSPKEKLTPETAHEIALRFAEEQFGGYEVLVTTHVDREHIHSHFIVNSVSCEDGRKYHSDRENLQALRQASDALCLQYGLSVVQPKEKSQKVGQMSFREYRSAERGESWKLRLAVTVEDAMKYARSKAHFISLMEAEGYAVKWTDERKSITYTTPEGFRCRDNKLHEAKFLKENMEYEFGIRTEILEGIERTGQSADPDGGESRTLRNGDRTELEGIDRRAEHAGQDARGNTGRAYPAGDGGKAHGLSERADGTAGTVLGGQQDHHRTVSDGDEEAVAGIGFGNRESDEGNRDTGWEYERNLFKQSLLGARYDEEIYEAAVLDRADPFAPSVGVGTDAAYLAASLVGILENDHPVEDSTTMRRPHRQKKKQEQGHGPVMGGM